MRDLCGNRLCTRAYSYIGSPARVTEQQRRFEDLETQLNEMSGEQKAVLDANNEEKKRRATLRRRKFFGQLYSHPGAAIDLSFPTDQHTVQVDEPEAHMLEQVIHQNDRRPWYVPFCISRTGLGSQMDQLRASFLEFYRALVLVQSFLDANKEGFRKIIKKHDKITGLDCKSYLEGIHYEGVDELKYLIEKTETMYTRYFTMGDRSRAMNELRVPEREHVPANWNALATGVLLGITLFSVLAISAGGVFFQASLFCYVPNSVTLLTAIIVSTTESADHRDWPAVFKMFRGVSLVAIMPFLIACNVYVWSWTGVNYVLIFNLNPRLVLYPVLFYLENVLYLL